MYKIKRFAAVKKFLTGAVKKLNRPYIPQKGYVAPISSGGKYKGGRKNLMDIAESHVDRYHPQNSPVMTPGYKVDVPVDPGYDPNKVNLSEISENFRKLDELTKTQALDYGKKMRWKK